MKSVLRSIKPYWLYLIITGKKTIEVGKNFPKSYEWNKIVELYCSKDTKSFNHISEKDREWMRKYIGKVACRFICDKIEKIKPCFEYYSNGYDIDDDTFSKTYLTREQFMEYGKGKSLYGWHISDLKIYDKPKPILQFYKPCPIEWKNCPGCELYSTYTGCCMNNINRPPESWCYVEEI